MTSCVRGVLQTALILCIESRRPMLLPLQRLFPNILPFRFTLAVLGRGGFGGRCRHCVLIVTRAGVRIVLMLECRSNREGITLVLLESVSVRVLATGRHLLAFLHLSFPDILAGVTGDGSRFCSYYCFRLIFLVLVRARICIEFMLVSQSNSECLVLV